MLIRECWQTDEVSEKKKKEKKKRKQKTRWKDKISKQALNG